MRQWDRDFFVHYSGPPSGAWGGVATFVRRRRGVQGIAAEVIVEARITRVRVNVQESAEVRIWNVHIFDLGDVGIRGACQRMRADIAEDTRSPTHRATWIVGDWNFLAGGDEVFRPTSEAGGPSEWRRARVPRHRRPGEAAFTQALAGALELAQSAQRAHTLLRLGRNRSSARPSLCGHPELGVRKASWHSARMGVS